MCKVQEVFNRGAGILLPISSLPSNWGIGTLGKEAKHFASFLQRARQTYWQILPIGPTGYGDSPFQSFSAFAGNPYLIDLDLLAEEGLLTAEDLAAAGPGGDAGSNDIDYSRLFTTRFTILHKAFARSKHAQTPEYAAFAAQHAGWLEDYALFMALKYHFDQRPWLEWEEDIALRSPAALARYRRLLADEIAFWKFTQFVFFSQLAGLKAHLQQCGIRLIGDMPIYVSMDSADVWASGENFLLDENKRPTKVAGVPPDAFSATGQLWGNPIYNWAYLEKTEYAWWKARMAHAAAIYDVIRIDHFIGFVKYYTIAYGAETAMEGVYEDGPGQRLIEAFGEVLGNTKIIAEDLGVSIDGVKQLLARAGYPSMKILQFAFDGNPFNEHLPFRYQNNMVAYTGTHDNTTMQAFVDELGVTDGLQADVWNYIRYVYSSVAATAIIPMQDFLRLGEDARINTPSTLGQNWRWRMKKDAIDDALADEIAALVACFGRQPM